MKINYTCFHAGKCRSNCPAQGLMPEKLRINCDKFKPVDVIDVENLIKPLEQSEEQDIVKKEI